MKRGPLVYVLDPSLDWTGALIAAARQASCLADLSEFVLVIPNANRVRAEELGVFRRVVRLPMVPPRRTLASLLLYLPSLLYCGWKLGRLLRADGCVRLQVNDFYMMQGSMARLFGYRGRLVTWVRIDPVRFGRLGQVLLRAARKASDRLVAVSSFIARQLGDSANTLIVHDPYPEQQVLLGDPAASQRLVFIGNYIEGKGQDQAIAAFARIAGRFPNARLELFGGDMGLDKNRAYRRRLEEQARRSGAGDRIRFEGFIDDTREPLRSARAALVLSQSESFSLTCQEASACGVPIIATRCGGPEEIVEDGVSGFLVGVGDVEATADRMARLLEDAGQARDMGEHGARLIAERFSTDAFRQAVAEVLDLPPR